MEKLDESWVIEEFAITWHFSCFDNDDAVDEFFDSVLAITLEFAVVPSDGSNETWIMVLWSRRRAREADVVILRGNGEDSEREKRKGNEKGVGVSLIP
jgi:hypothetical protein